ncbi:hypothetical protein A7979_06790 [Rothia nasimurium]|uniref:Uncharacterized protein n=1 Tax=Rothia nasimurium TaxID=85336 RepID=A0A1Y1RLY8_9MICC|nr:hypothetical protein A7979_06790 [Rothia nasimurium]
MPADIGFIKPTDCRKSCPGHTHAAAQGVHTAVEHMRLLARGRASLIAARHLIKAIVIVAAPHHIGALKSLHQFLSPRLCHDIVSVAQKNHIIFCCVNPPVARVVGALPLARVHISDIFVFLRKAEGNIFSRVGRSVI